MDKRELMNPFPGLRPFQSDEEHLFFGREKQTLELVQRLRDHRFLAVVGTSGSGKSSLVRCGLLSELQGGAFLQAGTEWEIAVMHPGGDPFRQLGEALLEADLYDPEEEDVLLKIGATLSRSRFGLIETVRQMRLSETSNVLLVVDQFEEIFRFGDLGEREGETADDFIGVLLEAARQSAVPIYVVITMRSDYIGDCARFEGLPEAVNDGEYLIPRLTREEYKSVIEGPIRVGGGQITPRLLQRLLNDIGDQADQLPCLQHALMRTWDAWGARAGAEALDLEDYRAIGGMHKALSIHADEIFAQLGAGEARTVASRMFRALTEKGEDNRGVRRPLRLKTLAAITGQPLEALRGVIEPYRQPGVTFLMPSVEASLEAETVIDISHESLMRVWQRLRGWVEEEAQSARIYQRLVETALLWKRGEAGLYHDPDLQIAQAWRASNDPNEAWASLYSGEFGEAMAFLEESEHEARRAEREAEEARQRELEQAQALADARQRVARNFKRFAVGMGLVAVVALLAFAYALKERDRANALTEQAVESEERWSRFSAQSDDRLGRQYLKSGDVSLGLAHLARSMEAMPENVSAMNRLFHLFAYESPPVYQAVSPKASPSRPLYSSVASPDGSVVAFSWNYDDVLVWNVERPSEYRQWEIPNVSGSAVWYDSLSLSPDAQHLFVGVTGSGRAELVHLPRWERVLSVDSSGSEAPKFSIRADRFFQLYRESGGNDGGGVRLSAFPSGEEEQVLGIDRFIYALRHPGEQQVVARLRGENPGEPDEIGFFSLETPNVPRISGVSSDWAEDGYLLGSFSRDGQRLLIQGMGENRHTFWVWNVSEARVLCSLVGHEAVPSGHERTTGRSAYWSERPEASDPAPWYAVAAFTPDGQQVVSAGMDKTVRVWDAETGEELQRLPMVEEIAWDCPPQFSEDGRRVMIRTRLHQCLVANFGERDGRLSSLRTLGNLVEGYAFLSDSGQVKPLLLAQGGMTCAAVHPNGAMMALGASDGQAGWVTLVDLRDGRRLGETARVIGRLVQVAFSEDGRQVGARSSQGTVRLWDSEDLSETPEILSPEMLNGGRVAVPLSMALDPDILAHSAENGLGYHFRHGLVEQNKDDLETTWMLKPVERGRKMSTEGGAVFDSAGTYFAGASDQPNSLRIISVKSEDEGTRGTEGESLPHEETIAALAISPDGALLAAGCTNGRIRLWQVPSGEAADHQEMKGNLPCLSVVFSPDGRALAGVFGERSQGYVQLWDVRTGQELSPPLKRDSFLNRAAFLDGGRRLVAWPESEELRQWGAASVWDVSFGAEESAPEWLPQVVASLGGRRLNEDSVAEVVPDRIAGPAPSETMGSQERRLAQFFDWAEKHPFQRTDSPFRTPASQAYLEDLVNQTSFAHLDELVRLRPRDPVARARRGMLRPFAGGNPTEPSKVSLRWVDLNWARRTAPENTEVAWYVAIASEVGGTEGMETVTYVDARALGALNREALSRVMGVQRLYSLVLSEAPRRELLDQSVALAREEDGEESLAYRDALMARFRFHARTRNFVALEADWEVLRELETLDADWSKALLQDWLTVAVAEGKRLDAEGDRARAVKLLEKVAVMEALYEAATHSEALSPGPALRLLDGWRSQEVPVDELVAASSEWRYHDQGVDQGLAWRENDFDDSEWALGVAKLGYGGPRDQIDTEIQSGPEDAHHPTTYFRQRFNVTEAQRKRFLNADIVRDDGVVVYLNGVEVARCDRMPEGEVTFETWASETASGTRTSPEWELATERFAFARPELLRVGENVIAVEVHQVGPDSSDLGFQLRLESTDHSAGPYLASLLRGEEGEALRQEAVAWLPQGLRDAWSLILVAAARPEGASFESSWEATARLLVLMEDWEGVINFTAMVLSHEASPPVETPWLETPVHRASGYQVQALRALGREQEAEEAMARCWLPPRASDTDPRQIDLSAFYNASLYDGNYQLWSSRAEYNLAWVPENFVPRHGVSFDLRGMIQLDSGVGANLPNPYSQVRPGRSSLSRVEGIPVGMRTSAIHFLMSSQYGREEAGVEVAQFILHYEDGESAILPVRYGDDVSDWFVSASRPQVPEERLGWQGSNAFFSPYNRIALSELVWTHPHPEKIIQSIDFVSTMKQCAPLLVGITLE